MKKIIIFFILFFLLTAFCPIEPANAATGLGIILGEPTGISFRYNNFPIIGIGWSFSGSGSFHLHCDYWIKNPPLKHSFSWYIGVGGKLFFGKYKDDKDNNDNKTGLTLRVPVGLQYFIDEQFELFGEIVPGMKIVPATDFDLDAGIGIRFYFN